MRSESFESIENRSLGVCWRLGFAVEKSEPDHALVRWGEEEGGHVSQQGDPFSVEDTVVRKTTNLQTM